MRAGLVSFSLFLLPSFALHMRRLCFLLLAFLFPLQLFAGMLEPVPKVLMHVQTSGHVVPVLGSVAERLQDFAVPLSLQLDADDLTVTAAAEITPEPEGGQGSADLEDQTLPAALATLALDWHPFPHLYPHVSGGSSVFIGLLRPPPAAA